MTVGIYSNTVEETYLFIDLNLKKIQSKFAKKGFIIEIHPEVRDFIFKKSYFPKLEPHVVKHITLQYIDDPLTEKILLDKFMKNDKNEYLIQITDEKVCILTNDLISRAQALGQDLLQKSNECKGA